MKTLVLTAHNDAFKPIGDLTTPLMERYAERHNYDFRLRRTRPIEWQVAHISFWRLLLVQQALESYERVLWLDADQVITNPAIRPPDSDLGLHLSQDYMPFDRHAGHVACGAYLACRSALPVFDWCLGRMNEWPDAKMAIRTAYEIFGHHFFVYGRHRFNAVPLEISQQVVEPWHKGDFLCHLTHVPMERKVELFPRIMEQAVFVPEFIRESIVA